jgi:YVTN family beta-propeller protein
MLNKLAKVVGIVVLAVSVGAAVNAQSIKGTIALPGLPEGIGVNFITNRIYVAIPNFDNISDSVAIIDGKSDTVISTISIPPVGQSVAVDVVRDLIYVGGTYFDVNGVEQSKVAVINGRTKKVVKTIPITTTEGNGIEGLAVDSLTGNVYVSNASDNVVDVICAETWRIIARISVAESPFGVTVNPFNDLVYVALSNGTVDVIDGRRNIIKTTATIGDANAGIAVDWSTGHVFVTNNDFGPSTLGVLDHKGDVITNIAVGNTPFGVDVDLITNLAFVTNTQDGTVSAIDGKTNTVKATLAVTGLYIAVNPATEKVYVGGQDSSLTVLKEK